MSRYGEASLGIIAPVCLYSPLNRSLHHPIPRLLLFGPSFLRFTVKTHPAVMSSNTNAFAQGTVLQVAYAMLALTSVVVVSRVAVQVHKMKNLSIPDYFVFFGFISHVIMCALYISASPYMKRVYDVINGKSPPYPELPEDSKVMTKMIFAAPCMFWMTLWAIKLSLMFLYRRLLVGIKKIYTIIWWILLALVILVGGWPIAVLHGD